MDLLANYGSDEDTDNEPLPHDKDDSNVLAQPCKRAKLDPGWVHLQCLLFMAAGVVCSPAMADVDAYRLLKDVHQPRLASVLPSAEALFAETAPGTTIAFNQATAAQSTEQSIRSANGWNLPPEPPRIRIFPHVEGNFATVVYITGETPGWCMQQAQKLAAEDCYTVLKDPINACFANVTRCDTLMCSRQVYNSSASGDHQDHSGKQCQATTCSSSRCRCSNQHSCNKPSIGPCNCTRPAALAHLCMVLSWGSSADLQQQQRQCI